MANEIDEVNDEAGMKFTGTFGVSGRRPLACMGCANAHGPKPWADMPTKSYCVAYPREEGARKPADVYYEGAGCRFRVPE